MTYCLNKLSIFNMTVAMYNCVIYKYLILKFADEILIDLCFSIIIHVFITLKKIIGL